MGLFSRLFGDQERASYDRSSGDMLVNEPQFMWLGHDSGGGRYPIGPNGPFATEGLPAITRLTSIIVDPLTASPWTVTESTTGLPRAGAVYAPPRWMTLFVVPWRERPPPFCLKGLRHVPLTWP